MADLLSQRLCRLVQSSGDAECIAYLLGRPYGEPVVIDYEFSPDRFGQFDVVEVLGNLEPSLIKKNEPIFRGVSQARLVSSNQVTVSLVLDLLCHRPGLTLQQCRIDASVFSRRSWRSVTLEQCTFSNVDPHVISSDSVSVSLPFKEAFPSQVGFDTELMFVHGHGLSLNPGFLRSSAMYGLRIAHINSCHVTEEAWEALAQLSPISLRFFDCLVEPRSIEFGTYPLSSVTELDLDLSGMGEREVREILQQAPKLTMLKLPTVELSPGCVASISELTELAWLDISRCQDLGGVDPAELNWKKLDQLVIPDSLGDRELLWMGRFGDIVSTAIV